MRIDTEAHAIEPEALTAPLSLRLGEARIQLGAMFTAGELRPLPPAVQSCLRGLECFLLDAAMIALQLESDAAMANARMRRRWFRFGGRWS